jgi:hypothetical protein
MLRHKIAPLKNDLRAPAVKIKKYAIRVLGRERLAIVVADGRLSVETEKRFPFCLRFRLSFNADHGRQRKTANGLYTLTRAFRDDEILLRYRITVGREMVAVQKLKAENIYADSDQLIKQTVRDVKDGRAYKTDTRNRDQNGGESLAFFSFGRNMFHNNLFSFSAGEKIL